MKFERLSARRFLSQPPQAALDGSPAFLAFSARRLGELAGEESRAYALDKIALAPRPGGDADVELDAPRPFPAAHELLEWPLVQPERACDVVRGARRQHADRHAASDHPAGDFGYGAVAAGDHDQVCRFFERALPAVFLRRLVAHLVARVAQQF